MDKVRLSELENKFITLRERGYSFKQAETLLSHVDKQYLICWEDNYQKILGELKKELSETPFLITSKDNNGSYEYQASELFGLISLDKIVFEMKMQQFADKAIEKEKIRYLRILQKYCLSAKLGLDTKGQLVVVVQAAIKDAKIKQMLNNAIKFYENYFLKNNILKNVVNLIHHKSNSIFTEVKNILPYAIKQLKIQHFQGIHEVSIENLNVDAQWIFLTGENNYGKTTVLQSIALALTGGNISNFGKENFAIELLYGKENIILNYFDKSNFQYFNCLVCYGASRLLIQTDYSKNDVGDKSAPVYSLFKPDGILLNIEFELYVWYLEKDNRFQWVVDTLKKLIPTIDNIVVDRKNRTTYYIEKFSSNQLTFNQLGSGYKSLIAMVGDMMIRLFKTQPDITKPSDLAGIVLIDELDLHWHPKWQRRLPTLLSEIFPKVQFIASTHSEIPLLGAPENSIFLKVTRTLEEGVKVHKIDIDLSNLLPNHVLTSALFDMDFNDITSVTHKPEQDLRTEDTMQEIKKTDDVEAYLKDYATNNAKFSDDLFD